MTDSGLLEKVGEKYHLANIREVFIECVGTSKEKAKEIVHGHYGESFAGKGIFRAGKVNVWKYIIYRLFMMKRQKF